MAVLVGSSAVATAPAALAVDGTSSVRIIKAGSGAPGQYFTFSATGQANTQLAIGDSVTYTYPPGTAFTVQEALPATTPAWHLTTITCFDGDGLPPDLILSIPTWSISATSQAGHLLICTFFNAQEPGLTVSKSASGLAQGDAWGPFDFTLSSSDGGTFTGSATQSISGTGPNWGTSVAGWTDLVDGKHYTIAESASSDWISVLTCAGVTDTDGTADGSVSFVASLGQVLACTATNNPVTRPDAQIRRPGGILKGNDIYNGDATGQMVYGGSYDAGTVRWVYLYVQNDGTSRQRFTFSASGAPVTGFKVKYFKSDGTDITAAVENGTFTTHGLNVGDRFGIRARIKITANAAHLAQVSRLITVASTSAAVPTDTVGFTFRRK